MGYCYVVTRQMQLEDDRVRSFSQVIRRLSAQWESNKAHYPADNQAYADFWGLTKPGDPAEGRLLIPRNAEPRLTRDLAPELRDLRRLTNLRPAERRRKNRWLAAQFQPMGGGQTQHLIPVPVNAKGALRGPGPGWA